MSSYITVVFRDGKIFHNDSPIHLGEQIDCGMGTVKFFTRPSATEVVRYSKSGREMYRKKFTRDGEWRIGAKKMYRVIQPEEETDPLRRLVRLAKLPIKILHRHKVGDEPLELSGQWAHLDCNWPNGRSSVLETDSPDEVVRGKLQNGPHYYRSRDWSVKITRATYAVVLGENSDHNGRIYKCVRAIHIWGDPSVEPVAIIVCGWLRGAGATQEMLEAERWGHLDEWMVKQIFSGSAPWMIKFGGHGEFPLCYYDYERAIRAKGKYQYPEYSNAIARIFNNLDNDSVLGMLPKEQLSYANALLNKEAAITWLSSCGGFYQLNSKLYHAESSGLLRAVERDRYEYYGPLTVMHRHGLYDDVLSFATVLGEPCVLETEYYCGDERFRTPDGGLYTGEYGTGVQEGSGKYVFLPGWRKPPKIWIIG